MAIGIAVKALYLQRHDVFVFDKIHTYVTKNKVSIFLSTGKLFTNINNVIKKTERPHWKDF